METPQDTLFTILMCLGVTYILFIRIPQEVLKLIRDHYYRKYPPHICDRSGDGTCLQCSLNAARAILENSATH